MPLSHLIIKLANENTEPYSYITPRLFLHITEKTLIFLITDWVMCHSNFHFQKKSLHIENLSYF